VFKVVHMAPGQKSPFLHFSNTQSALKPFCVVEKESVASLESQCYEKILKNLQKRTQIAKIMYRVPSVRGAEFQCAFYLRKDIIRDNGHHPIYVRLKFSNLDHVHIRKATGYSCRFEDWIPEKQRVRPQIRGGMELNANLTQFAKKAAEIHLHIKDMEVPPPNAIVDKLLFERTPTPNQKKLHKALLTFPEFVEQFLENVQNRLSINTIKAYRSSYLKVCEYARSKNIVPNFKMFDRLFGEHFAHYLATRRISNNTAGKYITSLKIMLREARKTGAEVKTDFEEYKIPSAPVDFVYFTSEELENLMMVNLSADRELDHARNTFLFQCCSGLRYSDILALEWENIVGDNIELVTKKTRQFLKIPLNRFTREVLERNHEMPKPLVAYANASQNRMLKTVSKTLGMTEKKVITRYYGSKREDSMVSKWQLVCTHTARRTFVILALERGMRPEVVMKITGHKKLSTLQRYISISDKVMQSEMSMAFG